MINRDLAEKRLSEKMKRITNAGQKKLLYKEIYGKFGIPIDTMDAMLNYRKELPEFSNFELYAAMWFMDPRGIDQCFTDQEKKDFSEAKVQDLAPEMVCEIDCLKVTEDQYIGVTDVQTLMSLRRRNIVQYKEGEQRVFKIVHSGQVEVKRIAVNRKAVRQIKEAMLKGTYIPDDITLRLPQETVYKITKGKIRIDSAPEGLNLVDGFHRWLAICEINNEQPDFNMPMEIRLVTFDERMTQQYIWQKDQKTLMKKVDSATYDRYALENMIVNRLNMSEILNGKIARTGGLVSFQDMTAILKRITSSLREENETDLQFANRVSKTLEDSISEIMAGRPELSIDPWKMRTTAIVIFCAIQENLSAKEKLELYEYLCKVSGEPENIELFKISGTMIRRKAMNVLSEAVKRWDLTRALKD